ncbi:hypothetical protein LEP1GSC168_0121 [Leptospira santarosai str. HAI134]|nr:hypothetical protein LEP1GSC168_0121 [Leptospira santarosai str. HAI134]
MPKSGPFATPQAWKGPGLPFYPALPYRSFLFLDFIPFLIVPFQCIALRPSRYTTHAWDGYIRLSL